ncbi:hypothetical protein PENTCL1PPCAC_29141, partial [Pristionchus entomophagus]
RSPMASHAMANASIGELPFAPTLHLLTNKPKEVQAFAPQPAPFAAPTLHLMQNQGKSNGEQAFAAAAALLFSCQKCDKKFPTQKGLKRHMFTHDAFGSKCPICNTVVTRSYLEQHIYNHSDKQIVAAESNVCPHPNCGVIRSKRAGMLHHLRVEHGAEPFECEKCGVKFSVRAKLLEHWKASGHRPPTKRDRRRNKKLPASK